MEHLSKLMTTIVQGWRDGRDHVLQTLQLYWTYHNELTIDNGLINKCTSDGGEEREIPQSMQAEMLHKIHPITLWPWVKFTRGKRRIILARYETSSL